jgi:two-component SAPR family response regulator
VSGPILPRPADMPSSVLLVEDNLIIALDTEEMLFAMGVDRVISAGNTSEALALLERERPDFALLDIELGTCTSFAVADRAIMLGVPFAFATGYGEPGSLPARFAQVPTCMKPYSRETLRRFICRTGELELARS